MYQFARKVLFCLNPEVSHTLSLNILSVGERLGLIKYLSGKVPDYPSQVMGLNFVNPVGLAAGLDKNGDYFNALGQLGFGFVEIGTVTPRAQLGNPAPRLFRLPQQQGIINRMGFNNQGVDYLLERVRQRRFAGILGINLGKNRDTSPSQALHDYQLGMRKVYALADYIAINISSPNTPGLRNLQFGEDLRSLLAGIKTEQQSLEKECRRYVPIAVKVAPDISEAEITDMAKVLLDHGLDAVIATNTTLSREGVQGSPQANEAGGLSGRPLADKSTAVIAQLYAELGGRLPIIGVGGICDGAGAVAKIKAGAQLVQIYSGFIYRGPALIAEAVQAIATASRPSVGG